MRFTKMHGSGNDYVFVDGFAEELDGDREDLARRISDRHSGIGSDGLILILPPEIPDADCRMEMYNADGSRGRMCGNGLRCLAKYVFDHGIRRRARLAVETDSGLRRAEVFLGQDGRVEQVEVDMGVPGLARREVPFDDGGDPARPAINVPLRVRHHEFHTTAVSMGNPHSVIFLDRPGGTRLPPGFETLDTIPLREWGPEFERHPSFPERTNTEFIRLRSRREIDLRVWERGSGETLACGTGACAAVVAAVLNGWCDREVLVHLRGGDLRIRWQEGAEDSTGGTVFMAGPAVEVFHGEW
jgi:diaminopimelate epimerase